MAYGYRPQRPGAIDPNDPRRKRIPLTPEEDPSLGIDPSFEVDLPSVPSMPIPDLPQAPAAIPPMGARSPVEQWQTPPASLRDFRAWYSNEAKVPGAPPPPEWGKQTPSYSRLHPPPPKSGTGQMLPQKLQPMPAGQVAPPSPLPPMMPGMTGGAPSAQAMSNPAIGGQQTFFQQAQQQIKQPATRGAGQGLDGRPVGAMQGVQGPPASPQLRSGSQQRATLPAAMQNQALAGARGASPASTSGQFLKTAGLQGAMQRQAQRPTPTMQAGLSPQSVGDQVKRRATELLTTAAAGGVAGALADPQGGQSYRTVPQIMRDVGLEIGSGFTNMASGAMLGLQEQQKQMEDMLPTVARFNQRFRNERAAEDLEAFLSPQGKATPKRPLYKEQFSYKDVDAFNESLLGQRTAGYQQRIKAYGNQVDEAAKDGIIKELAVTVGAIVDDPSLAEQMIVTNLPNILPGPVAGKVTQAVALARGMVGAKASQMGKAVSAGMGALMEGADARKGAFDEIKRELMSKGINEKQAEQEALKKSVLQGTVGALLGGATGYAGGLESAAFGQAKPGILPALGRGASELGEELVQELTPQGITNYQLKRPITQGMGRTAVETIIGTGPFAASAMFGGGAPKVPDALETEVTTEPTEPTGTFRGAIPKDERTARYETYVNAGGVRAPEPFNLQRKSRTMPGGADQTQSRQGQGLLNRPPAGLPPAPSQQGGTGTPGGGTPATPTTTQTATTPQTRPNVSSVPEGVTFRPGWAGARPVYAMDRPIVKTALERGPGTETAMAIEPQLTRLQEEFESGASMADYEEQLAKFTVGKLKRVPTPPSAPTAADVKFGGTEAGQVARNLNRSSTAVLKKVAPLYGVEEGTETAFKPVMEKVAEEMSELRGKPVSVEEARGAAMLGRKAEAQGKGDTALWPDWYNQYGKAKGIDKQQFNDLRNLAAGKVGFTFRPEIQEILLGYSGQPKANEEVMEVIREDMAKQMGLPYESISLTTIPPKAWSLWAQRRQIDRLAPEAYREMMEAVERSPRSLEMQEATTSKGKARAKTPARATATTPTKAPAVEVAPPAVEKAAGSRYEQQIQRGVPRAPLSMVPGVPSRRQGPGYQLLSGGRAATTGRPQGPVPQLRLPPQGQEARERQESQATKKRLKTASPFNRDRQVERERIERGKPVPPVAPSLEPSPAPTPPPTPATGEKKATTKPVVKETKPKAPAPRTISTNEIKSRGWDQAGNGDWQNASGETVARNARNTWTHTDRSGNTTSYPSLRDAFADILSKPEAEPVVPPAKAATPKTETTKPVAATTPSPAPAVSEKKVATKPGVISINDLDAIKSAGWSWNPAGNGSYRNASGETVAKNAQNLWIRTDKSGNTTSYPSLQDAFADAISSYKSQREAIAAQVAAFVSQMSPLQRGKALAALEREVKVNGRIVSRQTLVYEGVMRNGYTVVPHPVDKRRLTTEDSLWTESDISKTAMDFAEFLIKQKSSTKAPKAETTKPAATATAPSPVTPSGNKPEAVDEYKGTLEGFKSSLQSPPVRTQLLEVIAKGLEDRQKRKANVQTAPDNIKELFQVIDSSSGKKKATRTRIEADYPGIGKKALFINDNIEQIVAEAEATGKVTKVCP